MGCTWLLLTAVSLTSFVSRALLSTLTDVLPAHDSTSTSAPVSMRRSAVAINDARWIAIHARSNSSWSTMTSTTTPGIPVALPEGRSSSDRSIRWKLTQRQGQSDDKSSSGRCRLRSTSDPPFLVIRRQNTTADDESSARLSFVPCWNVELNQRNMPKTVVR